MDEPNIVSDISWYSHSSPISHQKPMIFSHCQWNLHRFFWLNGHIYWEYNVKIVSLPICLVVVYLPLWKIWNSLGVTIPNIWKNEIHVPNHKPATVFPSAEIPQRISRTIRGSPSYCYPSLECQVMTPHIAPGVFWNLWGLEQGGYHGRSWHNPMESHHFQRAFSIANCWFTGG